MMNSSTPGGPVGHRGLHSGPAAQPARLAGRCACFREGQARRSGAMTPQLVSDFDRIGKRALTIGAAGLALCALGWFLNPAQFYRSYLAGFLLWNGVALGCMAVAFLHQLSGGAWGVVIRRILESATRTFPLTAILFLPLLF